MISVRVFGAGFAALSCLLRFNSGKVKIDRALISAMVEDCGDSETVKAATSLGRALGLAVIAEGVESQAQADFLRDVGCDLAQGYAFAPPLEPAKFEAKYLVGSGRALPE